MQPDKWMGQVRGIVQTIEQKSGLNPILFVIALISLPSLFLYGFTGKDIFLWLIIGPVLFFCVVYLIAFRVDRNFLRSERHVYDMKQLDILGEKGKELSESEVLEIQPVTANEQQKRLKD